MTYLCVELWISHFACSFTALFRQKLQWKYNFVRIEHDFQCKTRNKLRFNEINRDNAKCGAISMSVRKDYVLFVLWMLGMVQADINDVMTWIFSAFQRKNCGFDSVRMFESHRNETPSKEMNSKLQKNCGNSSRTGATSRDANVKITLYIPTFEKFLTKWQLNSTKSTRIVWHQRSPVGSDCTWQTDINLSKWIHVHQTSSRPPLVLYKYKAHISALSHSICLSTLSGMSWAVWTLRCTQMT